jgi:sugar diacid utilization regulator
MASPTADVPGTPADGLRTLLDERREETEAALGIVNRITASLDVGEVLAESVSLAARVTDADAGILYLYEEPDRLVVRAASPGDERWIDSFALEVGARPAAWTALERSPVLLPSDPATDPRYLGHPDPERSFTSALSYPLVSPSERLVGAIALFTEGDRRFGEDDLVAVAPIASLAAARVETARLYSSSQRHIDVLRSVGGLGDSLVSPAATRRALHELGSATGRLLAASVVAIYVREQHTWRLSMSLVGQGRPPEDEIPVDVLGNLATDAGPRRISLPSDRLLVAAVAPEREGITTGVVAPLRASGETLGALVCLGEHQGISETDRELVSIIATVAGTMIQSGRLVDRLASRSVELSFLEALGEGSEPSGVVEARARQLGINLDEQHVAAAFQVIERGLGEADPERALDRLGTELMGRFHRSVVARRDLALLALLPVPPGAAVADEVNDAVNVIEGHDQIRLVGGLSGAVSGVDEYPQAFGEARDAVSINKVVGGTRQVVEYDALGALRHLWILARSPARDPFQTRVEHLLEYDAEHGTRFFETVEAYLGEQGSRERAAERLGIHRNTLRQRADRIREVSGINLEDRDNRFELQVAVGIVRFRRLQQSRHTDAYAF